MTSENPIVDLLVEEASSCINCGFCESVCPTLPVAGYNSIYGARGRVDLGNYLWKQFKKEGRVELRLTDSFYSCLNCNACLQVCPAGVNAGKVSDLSRRLIADSTILGSENVQPIAKMIVEVTKKYKNPLGIKNRCSSWSKGISFDESSSTLLYTGNMFQLMPYSVALSKMKKKIGERISNVFATTIANHPSLIKLVHLTPDAETRRRMEAELRSVVGLLKKSGISFSYLGQEEPYPGTFIYDLGYEEDFSRYAREVYSLFKSRGIKKLIVLDPHTYDLLSSKYPKYVEQFDIEVVYYLDLLNPGIFKKYGGSTTFHEPCLLVRGGKENNSAVNILSRLSKLELPKQNGKNTHCCGGPDELLYGEVAEGVSRERFKQLEMVNAQKIITACPVCFVNLSKNGEILELPEFLNELVSG